MKCDHCKHVFENGEEMIIRQGSFDQPMYFCDDECKEEFYKEDEE